MENSKQVGEGHDALKSLNAEPSVAETLSTTLHPAVMAIAAYNSIKAMSIVNGIIDDHIANGMHEMSALMATENRLKAVRLMVNEVLQGKETV